MNDHTPHLVHGSASIRSGSRFRPRGDKVYGSNPRREADLRAITTATVTTAAAGVGVLLGFPVALALAPAVGITILLTLHVARSNAMQHPVMRVIALWR